MNFSLPLLLNAACHGALVVDSFPTQRNVPCNLWKQAPWLSVTTRPSQRNVSKLPLSHTTAINNLSPRMKNNQRWKKNATLQAHRMNLWRIRIHFQVLKARQYSSFSVKTEAKRSEVQIHSPHLISMEQLQTAHLDNITNSNRASVVCQIRS